MRVLIAGRENARLLALSGYLTFRGFIVDHAPDVAEARALLEHIHYRALVAAIELGSLEHPALAELLRRAKAAPEGPHTVAVVQSAATSTEQWPEADLILGAELPIPHLASVVCASLAG
jgi:DNA-binding response OmpR family regulator